MTTVLALSLPAVIPSPEQGVWHLGPLPVRAYAMCILLGIVIATWWAGRRLEARGYPREDAVDIALWAVPFGIVGGRLYHVISSPQAYFGEGGQPIRALYIWEGGLGIWGAVALGLLGVWFGARRRGVPFLVFGDAVAPGYAVAQATGRLGNYFNNELYGGPTDLPWALQIHEWDQSAGHAVWDASGQAVVLGTFHPTFAYEALWCLGVAAVLIAVERRGRLRRGQVFALCIMLYTLGRVWIEALRIDPANHILGLRLNIWTSIIVFAIGATIFVLVGRRDQPAPVEADTPADLDM